MRLHTLVHRRSSTVLVLSTILSLFMEIQDLVKPTFYRQLVIQLKENIQNERFFTPLEKYYMDYVNATNLNKINSFKEKYRKFDVFIMDDIQFINGKERTQDELFHLFNSLYEMNKQIIFSSDKHLTLFKVLKIVYVLVLIME